MADVIHLLPDSVANQIAAGEVVQRPASVVKELMENSVDAGSTRIEVNVRDGGKALIQIIDDGCGMSETDARLCFERHATSKIAKADDLFAIKTMGFRGEALASIAAIAEVELRTRRASDQVGTYIRIVGSDVAKHEPAACAQGANFSIKNLFFNVPARRKFLKSTSLELKHIISEFQRVALGNPHVSMVLSHNGADIYNLPAANFKQRIVSLMGRNVNQQLLELNAPTSVIKISGFIGKPESAKKSPGEQFFFVNNRFMKNPYLHKAVTKSYEKLLAPDAIPPYFIYFEIDPEAIDVNIHPTKTEIKFEDERVIWQILHAAVRETLGKFAVVPSLDFESEMAVDIPFFPKSAPVSVPEIMVNPSYNPFEEENVRVRPTRGMQLDYQKKSVEGWQELYHNERGIGFEDEIVESKLNIDPEEEESLFPKATQRFFQFKNRYILSSVKSGLMVIDQRRAHERILFENFLLNLSMGPASAQQELFPHTIELSAGDFTLLDQIKEELSLLGVELSILGKDTVAVNALPAHLKIPNPEKFVIELLSYFKENMGNAKVDAHQKLAMSMAKASAIPYGRSLDPFEMQDLVDKLFACKQPNHSPDGKPVVHILQTDEIEKKFK
ncbi:MAG TPA: DNA mismatch repair endonuclease MutL [Tenuifilaceae bacterium]|nr:DNA mismatch repair endonuclease MutL [Tenuifilaceae bacterium]HPE18631.1 DNA mismatch repair endonuclease MutL [Tenuifilaceae bacterium]HPJ46087.1 DNA mismatch repair endonuclease MutL [Tenuifilaceae bacterium]HPQ34431.1 DNA mismatch repair endonuclease MutL [Tenuifilaceae bacterium]HRX67827.1 DNA mismatch repair endonuclease MutL [Tenuifilaceae bacterium]